LPYLKARASLICITSADAVRSVPYHSRRTRRRCELRRPLRVELEHEEAPVSLVNIMPTSINTPFETAPQSSAFSKGIRPYEPEVAAGDSVRSRTFAGLYVGGAPSSSPASTTGPRVTDQFLRLVGLPASAPRRKSADAAPLYAPSKARAKCTVARAGARSGASMPGCRRIQGCASGY
jgi:hypothetical protein